MLSERDDLKYFIGKTILEIKGGKIYDGELSFVFADETLIFEHDQDCCEYVFIEDVDGDLQDLIGVPLLMCEEVSNYDYDDGKNEERDSYTWTFYKFATIKGYVTVRWLGESNGYYSESVDIRVERRKIEWII